jgi:hypothetical protein
MRITFEYNEPLGTVTRRKTIVLGDDAEREIITGFADGASVAIQPVPLPRAAKVAHLHRGNQTWELSWATEREHADPAAARLFSIQHKIECLKMKGTLKITVGSRTFTGPAIISRMNTPADSVGKSTVTTYQVACDSLA